MSVTFTKQKAYVQLSRLQKVSSLLVKAQTTKEIAKIVVDEGFDALGAVSGDLILLSEDKKSFEFLAYKGYPESFFTKLPTNHTNTPLLTTKVVALKKPLFLKNENVDALSSEFKIARKFLMLTDSKAAVLVPLIIQNDVIGVVQFSFKESQTFSAEKKKFIYSLANQCAQALERAIALEKLRQSKEELEVILKRVADSVTVRDAEGIIVYVNDASCQFHQCSDPSELIGMHPEEYKKLFINTETEQGKQVQKGDLPSNQVFAGKKYAEGIFKVKLKKNNITMWVKIKSVGVYDKNKNLKFVVNVTQDITKEKQREYSKDEFISIASHELKTPVTSLKAFAQVLEKKFEKEHNDEAALLLGKMNYQIDRLTTLVTDLLDVTKIEGGKLILHKEHFNIDSLTKEIVEETQRITATHTIILKGKTKSQIIADRERTSQVITNLLTNAIKYSPEKDKVIVTLEKNRNDIVISVQDFGIGIPKNKQQHIFKRFYRETGFKENTFPGLGLGLYITAEIVKRHKGKIWVKSELGKGSTFSFSLPINKNRI